MEPRSFDAGLPINDYYKDGIIDYWTISNKGGWWTAVVYHIDPKTKKKQVSLYRWQRRNDMWKTTGCVRIKNKEKLSKLLSALAKIDFD